MSTSDNKKRVGRPKATMPKDTRIGIRLDDNTLTKLNDYCQKKGLSKSEVIRLALNELIK